MSTKTPISIRVDSRVLDWFKSHQPDGYQRLINSVLENFVFDQLSREQRNAGRAQEIFKQYYSRCFWHYNSDLKITPKNIHLVVAGLKKYGGREGLKLAQELCQ